MSKGRHRQTRLTVREDSALYRKCASMKRGYRTQAEAADAAEAMMDKGFVRAGCHITPYRCGECGEWHVRNRRVRFRV